MPLRGIYSLPLHVALPPSHSGDFLGKKKVSRNTELFPKYFIWCYCRCFKPQAVFCQQHGIKHPLLFCKLGPVRRLAMVWRVPRPLTSSPSEPNGTHPKGPGKLRACSSKAPQCSWAWRHSSQDPIVGYSSCRIWGRFILLALSYYLAAL